MLGRGAERLKTSALVAQFAQWVSLRQGCVTGFLSHVGSPKRDAELGHPTNSSIRDPVRSLGPWVFHRRKSSRGTTQVGGSSRRRQRAA